MLNFSSIRSVVSLAICITTLYSCHNNSISIVPSAPSSVLFDLSIREDATSAVVSSLMNSDENSISEIKFEKGVYHFYPDKGYESFQYISNHCDLMVNTPFPIKGFKNLTIDGQGSTFIFHGVIIPFLVEESENVTIKNLSIDWHEPFHSEGLIVAHNEENKTFDMKISDEYPYEIRNGQIYFVKEYYEHNMGQTILYDPNRMAIAFNTDAYTPITNWSPATAKNNIDNIDYKYIWDKRAPEYKNLGHENRITVEQLSPGLVRVHKHGKQLPPIGTILTMKGEQGLNRVSPAFKVTHTKGFKGLNVNIHHAGGMGIIAENSSDLILDNFNITPSKGRMVSTTADATHFVGCRGKVVLKNCTFNNQLDDASNIHGTYQKTVDILGDNKIGVRMMHHQQKGFVIGKPNDSIGLVKLEKSFFPYSKVTIKDIEYINSRYQIITFNENLPKNFKEGDLIENLSAYPELLVQNCKIGSNRARGLLISNPVSTVIENNEFNTEMEAILIPVESSHWFESGNAANVVIRNNIFQDCQYGGKKEGVIRFVTDDDNENIAFKNIEITNNVFNQYDNLILEIANTSGLIFENNTITNSGTFPQLYPESPVVKIKASKNVKLNNNKYSGKVAEDHMIEAIGLENPIDFK